MINKLPRWIFTPSSRYDSESVTQIEAIGKLQGKMNELVDEYNRFVDQANEKIENFTATTEEEQELFRVGMRQEFQDFIDTIEIRLNIADFTGRFEEAKTNMISDVTNAKNIMVEEIREALGSFCDELSELIGGNE